MKAMGLRTIEVGLGKTRNSLSSVTPNYTIDSLAMQQSLSVLSVPCLQCLDPFANRAHLICEKGPNQLSRRILLRFGETGRCIRKHRDMVSAIKYERHASATEAEKPGLTHSS